MSAQPPQWQTVLSMLEAAGAEGVHSVDMRRQFIANPSQRIIDLEKRGHTIRAERERSPYGPSNGVRYFLTASASGAASTAHLPPQGADRKSTEAAPETPAMFDLAGSPYDAWEAA